MMKFSVATNWDDGLIKEIDILDSGHRVTEIFGKLASDFIGGARPAYLLNAISKKNAARHIELVKKTGRKFNYLLNASCLDNREFTRSGQREIRKLISWLDSLGIDLISVANPYLGYLIRQKYPRFELAVSSHASVDSVRKGKFWINEIGANKITLNSHRIVRNFPLLKKIRSELNCELQLIANELCLHDCPFSFYHRNYVSHASQSRNSLKGFGIDWSIINCRHRLFTQPEEFIKATWIRPEDTGYYENAGIDSLKIIDRNRETPDIIAILKAYYIERKFQGNLIELLSFANKYPKKKLLVKGWRFFLHPLHINIFKLTKFRGLFSDTGMYVDNQKLDGFLDYFFQGKCKFDNCQNCDYCRRVAEKAVYIDNEKNQKAKKIYADIIESLTNGEMFRYP